MVVADYIQVHGAVNAPCSTVHPALIRAIRNMIFEDSVVLFWASYNYQKWISRKLVEICTWKHVRQMDTVPYPATSLKAI